MPVTGTVPFSVQLLSFEGGERFAILMDNEVGLPVAETTRYSAIYRRTRDGSVSTMGGELGAIALGMCWAKQRLIDLDQRLDSVTLFTREELQSLRDTLRINHQKKQSRSGKGSMTVVVSGTHYLRLHYFREYVIWRAEGAIHRIQNRADYLSATLRLEAFRKMFKLPKVRSREHEGLPVELLDLFREIIHPEHPLNPFQRANRHRNYALLLFHWHLGGRRADPLVLMGEDLNLSSSGATLTIHRRPNDPRDKRKKPPLIKTAGRVLPPGEELRAAFQSWCIDHRTDTDRYPGAKKCPFVFVARNGQPISLAAVYDMFRLIRKRFPQFPRNLASHMLRHSVNDRISRLATELKMPTGKEKQRRNYAMGWKKTSETGARYTRRAAREEANTLMLKLQEKSMEGRNR